MHFIDTAAFTVQISTRITEATPLQGYFLPSECTNYQYMVRS